MLHQRVPAVLLALCIGAGSVAADDWVTTADFSTDRSAAPADTGIVQTDFEFDDLTDDLDWLFDSPSQNAPPAPRDLPPQTWSMDGYFPYVQRVGVTHDAGKNVGVDTSYTTLEYMTPLLGDREWDFLFFDSRFILRNDTTLGSNIGFGYRFYDRTRNRIFGLNGYWDYRNTDENDFNQLGLGVESLGPRVDFRANVYIPDVYKTDSQLPSRFFGNLLVLREEVAMTGGDVEIGLTAFDSDRVQARVFAGGYHFDGHQTKDATGWRLRAEATADQRYWLDFSVQDDDVFGTTFTVGFALRQFHRFLPPNTQAHKPMDHMFFRRRGDADARNISYRLSAPVERQQNIAINGRALVATDPMGVPLNFLHVVEGAAGVGTFEDPYGTLTMALADGDAGTSIIYTPFGGDYVENITLVAGATVLSNGPEQFVETQQGTIKLPYSGASTDLMNLPTLTGNVDMADDSRFSGFDVTGAITANGVMNIVLDQSIVTNAAGDAVTLMGVDGATLDTLFLESGAGRGLLLDDSSATLTDITVTMATDDGVEITTAGTDRAVDITNLVVEDAGNEGLDVNLGGAGALEVTLSGMNSITAVGNGIDVALGGGSTADLSIAIDDTTITSTAGAGINVDGTAGVGELFITSLDGNTITTAATGGVLVDRATFDADPTTGAIDLVDAASLTIGDMDDTTAISGDGFRLIDPTGELSIGLLEIFNDSGTGLYVDTKGLGTTFALSTGPDSTIETTNGAAMFLDPLDIALEFDLVRSDDSPGNAIFLDTVTGSMNILTTILNGSVAPSIVIQNTPAPLTADFGETEIMSTISDMFNANVDTSVGNGANLTILFDSIEIVGP